MVIIELLVFIPKGVTATCRHPGNGAQFTQRAADRRMITVLGVGCWVLGVGSVYFLFSVLFLLVCFFRFYLCGLIAELGEAADDGFGAGLVGIVGDGDALSLYVALDVLYAFLETEVALDFVLTVSAVHLRLGGYYYGFNVLGQAGCCGQHHGA